MTSSINFPEVCEKIEILKKMHKELDMTDEEYVALREDISKTLLPLFSDLGNTDMLVFSFWKLKLETKPNIISRINLMVKD